MCKISALLVSVRSRIQESISICWCLGKFYRKLCPPPTPPQKEGKCVGKKKKCFCATFKNRPFLQKCFSENLCARIFYEVIYSLRKCVEFIVLKAACYKKLVKILLEENNIIPYSEISIIKKNSESALKNHLILYRFLTYLCIRGVHFFLFFFDSQHFYSVVYFIKYANMYFRFCIFF